MTYGILAGLFAGLIVLLIILRNRRPSKKLKHLRDCWGISPESNRDQEFAQDYFEFNKNSSFENSYCLDDDTWADLNLDAIFSLADRTITPIGSQYLYNLLRHPLLDGKILNERENLVTAFLKNQNLREKAQLALQGLAEENAKCLPYLLWKPLPDKPAYTKILPFIGIISFSVLMLALLKVVHFAVIIPVFFFNFVLRYLLKRKVEMHFYSFQSLGVLIGTANRLLKLKIPWLEIVQSDLNKNMEVTRSIAKETFALQLKDDFGIIEYLNIYFLMDISRFYSAIGKIERSLPELRNIYEAVGYLDSLIAIASFRTQYAKHCRPALTKDNKYFAVKNIYNPIVVNPVSNTSQFDVKNILITGSNMAGKTTFLKTMGVNAVLAQTINTSFAERYEAPFIKIMSSIERTDDIVLGKSYYLAEVESVLRLVQASQSDTIHLLILDEMFRGTNSVERHAASIEVLKYLANNKDYILAATHDLQLSEVLNHEYDNYHFREYVCDTGLEFDYKLHEGPSTTRNAIALLDYVGYPKSIVENAANRVAGKNTKHPAEN